MNAKLNGYKEASNTYLELGEGCAKIRVPG